MTRVSHGTFWQEPNGTMAASPAIILYLTYSSTRWGFSTLPSDQMGTFTLNADGDLQISPGVVSGGRIAAVGSGRRLRFLYVPDSTVLSAYEPGNDMTASRTGAAAYLSRTA